MLEPNEQSKGNPECGYKLNFSPSASGHQHDFCGPHDIRGAICPNCNKPLLRLLSLHANDPALNFDPTRYPVVHLLYCWTCSIPYGEFSYQMDCDGGVKLIEIPPRQPESEFGPEGPYDGFTGLFPAHRVALESLTDHEQEALRAWHAEDGGESSNLYFGHQVGGYPMIYNPYKAFCRQCSKEMPLLASICDDASGNGDFSSDEPEKTFTGNCGVQMVFNFCRDCALVTAYHSCD